MARHKIVAYKIQGKRGEMTITALTASPRGTRIPFAEVKIVTAGKDKETIHRELELAVDNLKAVGEES